MAPKKVTVGLDEKPKRKIVISTIQKKKELISKWESGTRLSDLAIQYGMARSTVATIMKNREAIKAADVAKGVKTLTSKRPPAMEEVEKLLVVWINEKQLAGDSVSKAKICQKARHLYSDITIYNPGAEEFKASKGWFDNFKKRSGIHNEITTTNKDSADKFMKDFKDFVDKEDFIPEQVFNCDETGLFWKKMPKRTYITEEEMSLSGHKPMKDRLTLLLCSNASGDFKIKPLLVYHSENPRAFKKNNVYKNRLGVMWRSNPKSKITRQFFTEWFDEVFAPSVKKYLEEKDLPLKALLILDNASAHPEGSEEDFSAEYDFIRVKFSPPNFINQIQSKSGGVISTFKKLYTRELFQRCFEVTSETQVTLRDFWKGHFNILHCLRIIDKAWHQVSYRTMRSFWMNLWTASVTEKDFEEPEQNAVVMEEIVSLTMSMGLYVNIEDVEELVEDHNTELTTEELQDLHMEQQKELAEELALEEEKAKGMISTADIKELLDCWSKTQSLVEKWHPNIAVLNRSINQFNDNVMQHFRKILTNRQKNE